MKHNKKVKENILNDECLSNEVTESLKKLPNRNRNDFNDMFYTQTKILNIAIDWIEEHIIKKGNNNQSQTLNFADFSAGDGAFGKYLKERQPNISYYGIDICPTSKSIKTQDFLSLNLNEGEEIARWRGIVGFNPPFGRAGKTAIKFINHAMSAKPKYLLVILPLRCFIYKGYKVIKEMYLDENSFYTFDNKKPFSTASIMLLLERDDENDILPHICEYTAENVGSNNVNFIVNDIPQIYLPTSKSMYLLITRKVGHYAGKQSYLISLSSYSPLKYNILYKDVKGIEKKWDNINIKFDNNGKWEYENKKYNKLPWEENGHIVCIHDTNAQTERSGIGFLKTQLILKNELTNEQQIDLLENINKYFNENPLCFGAPKSINCAILAHVLHKFI